MYYKAFAVETIATGHQQFIIDECRVHQCLITDDVTTLDEVGMDDDQ